MTNNVMIPGYPDALTAACHTFNVWPDVVTSRHKEQWLADLRHAIAWVAVNYLQQPVCEVADMLQRSHSTIIHSVRRAWQLIDTDPYFAALVAQLTDQFYSLCSTN